MTDSKKIEKLTYLVISLTIAIGLYLTSLYSYLLFHNLIEIITIAIAFTLFILTWNTQEYLKNNYLKLLGIGYASIALIDLVHTLAYKGMNVFPGYDANLPTQLWIAARYLQAVTLVAAPLVVGRRVDNRIVIGGYAAVVSLLVAMVYTGNFPDCFIEGKGLTLFKISSEYVISAFLLTSLYLLYRIRKNFNDRVYYLAVASITCTVFSEISFTAFVSLYGFTNLVGHFAKLAAYYLLYRAILVTGLKDPMDLIFRDLKQAEESLRKAYDTLEKKVQERTAELHSSMEEIRDLYNHTPCGYHSLDKDGVFVRINDTELSWLGYRQEEILGKKRFDDLINEKGRQIFHEKFPLFKKQGWIRDLEFELMRKNGTTFPVLVSATAICDDDGNYLMSRSSVFDITDRKQAEDALRKSEEQYRRLLDTIQEGIWVIDKESITTFANPRMAEMLGYSPTEMIGKSLFVFMDEQGKLIAERNVESRKQGIREQHDFEFIRKGGERIYTSLETGPILDESGQYAGAIAAVADVSERKRAEQERLASLNYFESMDRVDRAIQGKNDLEQMMNDVLGIILSVFDCDRAFFVYPCDPEAVSYRVPMERTKPEYPGALTKGIEVPVDAEAIRVFKAVMGTDNPVTFGPGSDAALPPDLTKYFGVQSQIAMAVYPKVDKPYMFGLHQCSHPRLWTAEETKLLREICRRLGDALTSLLTYRNLQESETRFRTLVDQAADAMFLHDMDGRLLDVNQRSCDSLGFTRDELLEMNVSDVDAQFISHNHVNDFWSELRPDHPVTLEGMHKRKDGTLFPVEVRLGLIRIKDQSAILALARDITERKRMEDALFFVAQRGWLADAENFFNALAHYLGENLDMDYVFIDRIDENPDIAETVALYAKGAIVTNMRYALKGTPCENVMGRRLCLYPQGVQQLFPEDTLLAEMSVESYIGIPLWDFSGRPIGLIALMGSKPLSDAAPATQLLQLVATRAAAELIRERSDRILRMREHEFRTLAESLPDNIVRYDREGRTVYVNPVLEKTLGAAAKEMIGKRIREIHPDGSYETYAQDVDAALTSGENSEKEYLMPDPSKEPIIHQIRIIAERDEHGEVTGVLAIGRDITERKRADKSIRKLSQAIEQSPVSIIITDAAGKIEFVNPKFTQITGYTYAEVMGKNPRILKSGETLLQEYQRLWKTIRSGEVWQGEFHNRKKNGELFWEQATIAPLKNENNIITNYVAVKEDITERKKLEEQLRQAQKMEAIGTLAGGIAHDFNNILTAIIGYGHLALMKMENVDPLRLEIQHMLDAGDRAAHLTNDLLLFSRKQISERKSVDLNDIIRKVEKFLKRVIGEDVECKAQLSNEELHILGDAHQIEQVLMNFATNARDAMPAGGIFTIATERVRIDDEFVSLHGYGKPDNYALTTISDTGKGMDSATREHIFEPFFTTKEAGKGTGLGLAVVYGIIKQHEGFVNVYSEPGRGTTFKIYLPIIAAQADAIAVAVEEHPEGGAETILLAEDDETVRIMTRTVLEQFGYTVLEAIDGQDAVQMYEKNKDKIHLLLFDLIMPKKTGKEAYDEIRAMAPGVKALFASGYAPDMVRQKMLVEDGMTLVFKPSTPTELLKKVREALER